MINSRTYFLRDINLGPAALKYTRFCHLSCHRGADTWRRRCPVCPQPPPCCVTREDLLPQFPRTLVRGETWLGVWAEGRVRLSESLGGKARSVPTPLAWVSILTLATRGGAPRDQGAGRGPRGTPWRCARCPERFQEDEGEGRGASAVALRPREGIRPHGVSGVLGTDVSVVAWEGRDGRAAGTLGTEGSSGTLTAGEGRGGRPSRTRCPRQCARPLPPPGGSGVGAGLLLAGCRVGCLRGPGACSDE